MHGHCILSHGFESGPDARKVTALAQVAEAAGFSHERPDYTGLDARRHISRVGDVPARLERLIERIDAAPAGPLVLAGSSLGAWTSARATLQRPVAALFLLAPPVELDAAHPLQAAMLPTSIVHGWNDELIDAQQVIGWARERQATLLLVNDGHRLEASIGASCDAFARLLAQVREAAA